MELPAFEERLKRAIADGTELVRRGRVSLAEYDRWFGLVASLLELGLGRDHPRKRSLYAADSGEPRVFAPDFGQGGGDDWTAPLAAKVADLEATLDLLPDIWAGRETAGATPVKPSRQGGAPTIHVEANPTIHNTATATATATSTATLDASWNALHRALDALPAGEREEAHWEARELRENIEKGGPTDRLGALLKRFMSKSGEIALKLLPLLVEYGPKILERLRHLAGG
jgi:hypothetical protein